MNLLLCEVKRVEIISTLSIYVYTRNNCVTELSRFFVSDPRHDSLLVWANVGYKSVSILRKNFLIG